MAQQQTELTDKQWAKIAPLIPEPKRSPDGGPRPIANRPCFEGILWVLRRGARWKDLPKGRFPSASTCWRRLHDWEQAGIWLKVWRAFLAELDEKGRLKWNETFADGTFSPAKKGAHASARPNAERVRSLWWWQTARVFLWECPLPRPHQMKSYSSKPRWNKWPCPGKGAGVRGRTHRG